MPTFAYTARTLNGELKSATLEAPSRDEVIAQLRRQRLIVVKIDEEKKRKRMGKIKTKDIVIRRENFSFYFPIVTSLIASIVLTLIFWLFRR